MKQNIDTRSTEAVARWVRGQSLQEIADALGFSSQSVVKDLFGRLRRNGYAVPRRKPGQGCIWLDQLPERPIIIPVGAQGKQVPTTRQEGKTDASA